MKTEWSDESCNELPERFQQLNSDTYIQRKNIRKEEDRDVNGEPIIRYRCLSRFISKDVYNDFVDALDDMAQLELMNEFDLVKNTLKDNEEANLIIMNALADIYEMGL